MISGDFTHISPIFKPSENFPAETEYQGTFEACSVRTSQAHCRRSFPSRAAASFQASKVEASAVRTRVFSGASEMEEAEVPAGFCSIKRKINLSACIGIPRDDESQLLTVLTLLPVCSASHFLSCRIAFNHTLTSFFSMSAGYSLFEDCSVRTSQAHCRRSFPSRAAASFQASKVEASAVRTRVFSGASEMEEAEVPTGYCSIKEAIKT